MYEITYKFVADDGTGWESHMVTRDKHEAMIHLQGVADDLS